MTLLVPRRKTTVADDMFAYYGVKRNFTVRSLSAPDWIRFGSLGFAFSLLWFSEVATWSKAFREADIVYSRDAFVLLQYVLLGRKLVYEAHMTPTLISRIVARAAFRVVVISGGLKDAYVAAGVSAKKIVIAHDAVDPALFAASHDKSQSRSWLQIPQDARVVMYVGKVEDAKGTNTFASAGELAPEGTVFVVIGEGKEKALLAKKHPRVLFLPETPYRELPRVLAAADVLAIPNSAHDLDASRFTSPLKAFAYLASKKPIVASDVPALREILEGRATFFTPDDPSALLEATTKAVSPSDTLPDYSWNNRARIITEALSI
jgi:glycosyltransferase involved in cell wall biosynthesis